jgi:HlyD family secretion protein
MFKKILKFFLTLLILAAVAAGGWYAYRELTKPKPLDVSALRTEEVRRGNLLLTVHATGKISGLTETSLFLEASQKVARVPVREGDRVQAGDVLVEYDITQERDELLRREREVLLSIENAELTLQNLLLPAAGNELLQYQSDVAQSEKSVMDAETDIRSHQLRIAQQEIKITEAERALERSHALFLGGAITRREYEFSQTQLTDQHDILDNLHIQLETRQRTLELREAHLRDAQARLRNVRNRGNDPAVDIKYQQQENAIALSRIELERIRADLDRLAEVTVSPIDGHVAALNVKEGQTAARGGEIIRLEDQSGLMVKADISEYDAPKIAPGFDALVSTQGLPGVYFNAKVETVASAALERDGSDDVVVPMEFRLLNTDSRLKAGFSVDVDIVLEKAENVLYIPASALLPSPNGGAAVYVVRGMEAVSVAVETGLSAGRNVEIKDGLQEGDAVVTDPSGLR